MKEAEADPYLVVVLVDVAASGRVKVARVPLLLGVVHLPELDSPIDGVGRIRRIHGSTKDMKLLRYIFLLFNKTSKV